MFHAKQRFFEAIAASSVLFAHQEGIKSVKSFVSNVSRETSDRFGLALVIIPPTIFNKGLGIVFVHQPLFHVKQWGF